MSQTDLTELERGIARILIDTLKLENATPDGFNMTMNLVEELGIDSMDMTTVVLVLQDEYKVKIDEDLYTQLTSVRAIARCVHELRAAA